MTSKSNRETRTASEVKSVEDAARIEKAFKKRDEKVFVQRVSHIGIVVKDIFDALSAFDKLFEMVRDVRVETETDQGVKVAIVSFGGTEIEFIQPIESGTGVARFLERRGEGLHHIGLEVKDINETLKNVGAKGAEVIDKQPWHGLRGDTAFIHPTSLKGVLVELVQPASESEK